MFSIIIMLLCIVLAALTIISLVKNFLINFNVSDNGWMTVMVTVLAVICLLSALISYTEAYTIRDISVMQPSTELKQEQIDQLKDQIHTKTIVSIFSLCLACIAYFSHLRVIRNIKVKKLKEMESNAVYRWTHVK